MASALCQLSYVCLPYSIFPMSLKIYQHAVRTLWSIPAHNPVLKNGNHNRSEIPSGQPIFGMFSEHTDRPSRVSEQQPASTARRQLTGFSLLLFWSKKTPPCFITCRPNTNLPGSAGFAGSQGRCTTPQDRWLAAPSKSWLSLLQSLKYNTSGKHQWEPYPRNSRKGLILYLLELRGGSSFLHIPSSALRTAQGAAVATDSLKNLLLS